MERESLDRKTSSIHPTIEIMGILEVDFVKFTRQNGVDTQ